MVEMKEVLRDEKGRLYYAATQAKLPGVFDEQFVVVDSPAEARFVDERLNDAEARETKTMRLGFLARKGEVAEEDMPDVRAAADHVARVTASNLRARQYAEEYDAPATETRVVATDNVSLAVDGLEVYLPRNKDGYIKLDGQLVRGVQALKVECSTKHDPKVTLELLTARPQDAKS